MAQTERIRLQCGRLGFDPWLGKIPWRREWLSTPVFLSGESHGRRSPRGRKVSDTTEQLAHAVCESIHMWWGAGGGCRDLLPSPNPPELLPSAVEFQTFPIR